MTLGLWMSTSVIARVDMVLAAFITTSLASFSARYHLGRQAVSHVFWAACAGAVLTKGPVGVILPGAIIGGLIIGVGEKVAEIYWGPLVGGAIENWFAYVLALAFLLFRPQGLFGERIIERV